MAYPKGAPRPKGAGRPKGARNKNTQQLRDMILGALSKAGGQDYLVRQAKENPGPFMTLIGKVLPTTIAGDPENPIKMESKIDLNLPPEEAYKRYIQGVEGSD